MNCDSADENNDADMSLGSEAAIYLNAESMTHMSSFRNPDPISEISLASCNTRELQWDNTLNITNADDNDEEPSLLNIQMQAPINNSRERFLGVIYAFVGTSATHLQTPLCVDSLPELCTIRDTVNAFCLNKEQTAAFTILTAYLLSFEDSFKLTTTNTDELCVARLTMENIHADCLHNNLLFFVLHGPAGTGKSRVIHALHELWNLSSTVLVTATTGAAAILLSAQTYHSALQLNPKKSAKIVPPQLRAPFLSLRILIIDEMSMLGTTGLSKIDQRLRFLRGCDVAPFGGLGVTLIGDFTQLQPVRDTALFTQFGNNLSL